MLAIEGPPTTHPNVPHILGVAVIKGPASLQWLGAGRVAVGCRHAAELGPRRAVAHRDRIITDAW